MKRLTMTVATASVVFLGLAGTPARADQNDVARVIVGLAGIAALATILNDRTDRKVEVTRQQPLAVTPKYRGRGHGKRVRHRIDYNQCLRQRWTNAGWETFVSNRCVKRLQRQAHRDRGYRHGPYARR